MSFALGLLCERTSLTSGQPHRLIFLNEHFLRRMVEYEADTLFIGFEAKFLGDEADIYIRFVTVLVSLN